MKYEYELVTPVSSFVEKETKRVEIEVKRLETGEIAVGVRTGYAPMSRGVVLFSSRGTFSIRNPKDYTDILYQGRIEEYLD